MMSKEAIAHYEAALKEAFPRGATGEVFHHWNEARYLIATEALDRMAENARELGLDYEQPAQQEPYGWIGNDSGSFIKNVGQNKVTGKPLYTSPPAQRKPLTDAEIKAVIAKIDPNEHYLPNALRQLTRAIEAAHGITEEKK
jgi:hypothetical protein